MSELDVLCMVLMRFEGRHDMTPLIWFDLDAYNLQSLPLDSERKRTILAAIRLVFSQVSVGSCLSFSDRRCDTTETLKALPLYQERGLHQTTGNSHLICRPRHVLSQ